MDTDLALVAGLAVGAVAIPAALSAWSEGRVPRAAAVAALAAGGLVIWALTAKPGGYTLAEIPETVIAVLARLLP
jgi:hypothetical protein